jgi:MFS family permease
MQQDMGLTKTQMGYAFTAFGIAYGLFEIPGGWLGDRFGPRLVLLRVVSLWSIFTIATGWAWNLASLVVSRFLFGAGEAGCFPNITKAFTHWFPPAERVRAQAVLWLSARWGGAPLAEPTLLIVTFVALSPLAPATEDCLPATFLSICVACV